MPYWRLYYHVVWSTKYRDPLITSEVEPVIYGYIRNKVIGLKGFVFALNGMADHVHLVVAIPPSISVSSFVGQVKGVTSAKFNRYFHLENLFYWQDEFGVFSFDHKRLPNVVAYVENQKVHHAGAAIIPILEQMEAPDHSELHDMKANYLLKDHQWWQDMLDMG